FFIRDLDEFERVFLEESPKRHGEQTRVDHREVIIQDADERHQMQARRGALEVRQWDRLYVNADRFHGFADLSQSVGVRAEYLADSEEVVVHPKECDSFGGGIAMQ